MPKLNLQGLWLFFYAQITGGKELFMKALLTTIAAVVLAVLLQTIGSIAINHVEAEHNRATAAINAVRAQSYVKMLEAQAEGNMHKLAYYRWNYNNAEKVVADYGVDAILAKEKNR